MLDDIKKTLWATADKLRANMDAAEYKHLVLGLIFVKYISDTFAARRAEVVARLADPNDEYFYGDASPEDLAAEADDRDYYTAVNVFRVPEAARWESLRAQAKRPEIGKLIDEALSLIEAENPKLKGILDKRYARAEAQKQLPDGKLGELVDLVSAIGFGENPKSQQPPNPQGGRGTWERPGVATARDVLGQVYEYFLGMFASAEGKRGGQFYTPASIVKTLVAVLAPHHGQVYDPCCGSGGMFVQSERFIEAHGGKLGDVSIYGQEANPTTWRLAAMNLAIRGIDFNLGREPGDTFTRNQHPDLRADFILANPPFNISDWWHGSLEGDPRWHYGDPPQGNANYAWLQHMLHHLKPSGRAGIVLANGSMSSSQNNEGVIRAAMVEADVVEVMIALPGQLFFNTQIPACLWFLAKHKRPERKGQVLFIDARKLGRMISRVQCEFSDEEIERIAATVAAWRGEAPAGEPVGEYADVPGFCRSVPLSEIAQHGHVLTPGRYVGAEAVEDDDEAFAEKMTRLTEQLGEQMAKGAELDALIRAKLGGLGYEF
jgi:type I restriction enzyme M protein